MPLLTRISTGIQHCLTDWQSVALLVLIYTLHIRITYHTLCVIAESKNIKTVSETFLSFVRLTSRKLQTAVSELFQSHSALHFAYQQWLTSKVLCPLFVMKLRFWYQVIAGEYCHLWTKCGILIHYRNEEKLLYWSSSSNLSGCPKALCPFHSFAKILSPSVDLVPRPTLLYDM